MQKIETVRNSQKRNHPKLAKRKPPETRENKPLKTRKTLKAMQNSQEKNHPRYKKYEMSGNRKKISHPKVKNETDQT